MDNTITVVLNHSFRARNLCSQPKSKIVFHNIDTKELISGIDLSDYCLVCESSAMYFTGLSCSSLFLPGIIDFLESFLSEHFVSSLSLETDLPASATARKEMVISSLLLKGSHYFPNILLFPIIAKPRLHFPLGFLLINISVFNYSLTHLHRSDIDIVVVEHIFVYFFFLSYMIYLFSCSQEYLLNNSSITLFCVSRPLFR